MTTWGWLQILAAVSAIVLAALALLDRSHSPFRLPLTLLAVNQFTWNFSSVGQTLTGDPNSAWVGIVAAPLFTPMALHYVLTFVGRRRPLAWFLTVTYVVFGAQTVTAAIDALTSFDLPGGFHTYALMLLVPSAPVALIGITLVWRHHRSALGEAERFRSKLLIVALTAVVFLMATDLLVDLGFALPRLADLGSFTFNVFLAQITLGISGGTDRRRVLGQAFIGVLFIVAAYLSLFLTLGNQLGVLIIAMSGLSFALLGAAGVAWRSLSHERAGLERFATAGRFSAQMAHDLKNPLAAAKGAAEFLSEELRRAQLTEQREFSVLIVQQLDRLTEIIDRYQRLSSLQLAPQTVDLNALVAQVLSLQGFATATSVQVVQLLEPSVPPITADPQLLSSAIENLVKNAFEAMGDGGQLTVSTSVDQDAVHLAIKDTGQGMDARTREQAFTVFFTTKTTGTGLGLAFVQQIARAHGGEVMLTSREGQGTMVELILPRGHDDEPRYRTGR